MNHIWIKKDLEKALDRLILVETDYFGKIEFNSKQIKENDVFIALREGQGDGHDYINDALDRGAAFAIVEKYSSENLFKQILVKNSLEALYRIAEYKRKTSKAKIIAITGSLGKTSFKEILSKMISSSSKVFSSHKNFNNYIGVPLNLASMPSDIDYGIFEVGMNHSGEISNIVKILKPDIGVITSIAPVHIENFDSIKGIVDAKLELFNYLGNSRVTAIINGDSEHFEYMKQSLSDKRIEKIYSFGMNEGLNSICSNYNQSFNKSNFDIKIKDKKYHVETSLIGKHQACNITGAALVSALEGLDVQISLDSLVDMKPLDGRGNIINVKFLGKDLAIINDAYNASPNSMKASFENYKYSKSDKKAVIIGDMKELGKNSKQYHEDLDEYIIESGAKIVIMIGPYMKYLYDKLTNKKDKLICFYCPDVDSTILEIEKYLQDSDIVLIKASNSMNLYKIVEYLKGC